MGVIFCARQWHILTLNATVESGQGQNNGEKLKQLARWSLDNFEFDAMMRVDDDNFLCVSHLFHDLDQMLKVSDDFVWGWWFGPYMLYNENPETHGPWGDSAGEFCEVFGGRRNAVNNWRPDEMGMIIASQILRDLFCTTLDAGRSLPSWDLMDVSLTQWIKNRTVTYVVDNARFFRGNYSYKPDLSPPTDSPQFCSNYISFHKAHPKAMMAMWKNQQAESTYSNFSIHRNCLYSKSEAVNVTHEVPEMNFTVDIGAATHIYVDVGTYILTQFTQIL